MQPCILSLNRKLMDCMLQSNINKAAESMYLALVAEEA
jgi:hypothetical protein